ncbi:MAG: hypothetical protein OHK0021_17920 [Bryobacter sp.]|nr:hypothetical protein [Bryobacter sp.]
MQEARRCGLIGISAGPNPVWAKEDAIFYQCPESMLTGELWHWINLAATLQQQSNFDWLSVPAVDCDALQTIWQWKGKKLNARNEG